MDVPEHRLEADGIAVTLDLGNGHIAALEIEGHGKRLSPLHRAPWVGEDLPEGLPSGLARLSGDFFCAPFSVSDVEPAPTHGWPGNAPWALVHQERAGADSSATYRLSRPVMGAKIEKQFRLRDGHPFLYQEHRLIGGAGQLSVAHHVMTRMEGGGRLDVSPKRFAMTGDAPLEPDFSRGRYALKYPAESADLATFPLQGGGTADLHAYPPADRHEDFVTLAEDGDGLGWTALSRRVENDLLLVLKPASVLPVTMLWMSNGGRDYAPWNGRHTGVLGIEDGRTAIGHAASIGDNSLKQAGIATAFTLGGTIVVRHVIGAVPVADHARTTAIQVERGRLVINRDGTDPITLPFDGTFLA